MHIDSRNIRADKPNLNIRELLIAILEYRCEDWCMEFLNLRAAACSSSAHIREIGILGELRRESLCIVTVPCIHEAVHHTTNCPLVRLAAILATQRSRQEKSNEQRAHPQHSTLHMLAV
jgi:hypothetical protein